MTAAPVPSLLAEATTNTPLREVVVGHEGATHRLWLKLEQYNPTGSIKYRTAVGLVEALNAARPLVAGTRVVESTSGNLGVALGRILAKYGCHLIVVVDPKVPAAVRDAMLNDGTRVVVVRERDEHGGYLLTRLATVRRLCRADPALRWTDQYNNCANPDIHRRSTAIELVRQTGGWVDVVLAAVSTGGTLAGISEGMRAAVPGVQMYAVDVHGSLVTSDCGAPHLLTGIGATRKSSFLRPGHADRALRVFDVEAFAYCRMLAEDTGLAVGGSGGAVLAAYTNALGTGMEGFDCPVAVMPDSAASYRRTIYDDGWLAEHGVLDAVRGVVAEARRRRVSFGRGAAAHPAMTGA